MLLTLLLHITQVIARKCVVTTTSVSPPIITPVGQPFVLLETFGDGIPCDNVTPSANTIGVSVNPSIFGITEDIWVNQIVNTRNFSWCGKGLNLTTNKQSFLLTVTSFCPLERLDFTVDSSNGAKHGEKCFFTNSINFLDQDSVLQQISQDNPYFPGIGDVSIRLL